MDELLSRFNRVRQTTESLREPLAIEDTVVQTSTECSPVKWHLAHTTWFFETFVLKAFAKKYPEFHPTFNYLFNSYYNTIGDRTPRPARGLMTRPTLEQVMNYREHVDAAMQKMLQSLDEHSEAIPIIELGLNHEQQHQELIITDVKTVLAMNPMRPVYREREIGKAIVAPMSWSSFDEGINEIGTNGLGFFFDNEGPRHRQYLQQFALANRLITNGEFKEFIAAGGYRTPTLWLSDGFAKCAEEHWMAPKYWEMQDDGVWWNMTLQGFRPVEDSEPVTHISHFEADAFATWYGARLPTEFEWEIAAQGVAIQGNFQDNLLFHPAPGNFDSANPSSKTEQSSPLHQMYGDVWEWTRSAYLPYPGYKPVPGAIGEYNGKFMSNQMVLRGGSCATPRGHIRSTYRNFFPPESRWQFSGIRLAK